MELADILLLVKAGYTREEIAQMDTQAPTNANAEPVPVPVETHPEETKPAEQTPQVVEPVATPVPAPAPVPTPQTQQVEPSMADIMQSIAKLTSAVQANAIAHSVIPQGLQNPPSAEDMIAEIIRPAYKERS